MNLGQALAWLDRHQNLERILADKRLAVPEPERMRALMDILGEPQHTQPVLHLTGTNGKTSAARCLAQILVSKGLTAGTYTSPHLQRVNERLAVDFEAISDYELAEVLSGIAAVEHLLPEGMRPTWFELMTAAAFRWFAEKPVDVAVVEVGLGGRWDATNVADGLVSVVTNVGLDHVELLGPTRAHIAKEKAGIVKPGSTLVLGERDPDLYDIFASEAAATVLWAGRDFDVEANDVAVGGRLVDLRTPGARYEGVFLALHGAHQAQNFACALVAAEAFFGRPIEDKLVAEAAALVRSPGRMEVMSQHPLVVLDGAKNVDGATASAMSLAQEFGWRGVPQPGQVPGQGNRRVMVVGMLSGKDPAQMLEALGARSADLLVACAAPSPRAQPAEDIAAAAEVLGVRSVVCPSVGEALETAIAEAGDNGMVLVTGSLYVVGAARTALTGEDVPATFHE
ncbi:MAG TPA: folylpolyglutamate synthase/dihydrofolate synthase family protein [Acidimicrobiales bacterium]|nr:folylpolyglutamate synthase/dihydrofolate synthase family protein [Acidimicrobiales bacterium]